MMMQNLTKLEKQLGYSFKEKGLLEHALTHRSAAKKHNERLEFLGDSILNLAITQALFKQFPQCNEGELSRMRSTLVREQTLVLFAKQFHLSDYMKLGSGELKSGGYRRESILADAVEAIIGAVSLDSDLAQTIGLVQHWFDNMLTDIKPGENQKDPKTRLQEWLQAKGIAVPTYQIIKTSGKAHCQIFTVQCDVPHFNQQVIADGSSRRKAEQQAAQLILNHLIENKK